MSQHYQEIIQEALVACSDGAHGSSSLVASHEWVFGSNTLEMIQATGDGLVDGNTKLILSYRAEISGVVAVLYLTYRICNY
jgi:hypothetical protein